MQNSAFSIGIQHSGSGRQSGSSANAGRERRVRTSYRSSGVAEVIMHAQILAGSRLSYSSSISVFGSASKETRTESLANQATLTVAPVGIESVADDRLAVADKISDNRHHRAGHFGKINVGVGNRRSDGNGLFPDLSDSHTIVVSQAAKG